MNFKVYLVSGGFGTGKYLDSTEMLVEDQTSWTKVNGLTLPSARRGPFMINLNNPQGDNAVFLTGMLIYYRVVRPNNNFDEY